jgi:acetyl esterase/lipase
LDMTGEPELAGPQGRALLALLEFEVMKTDPTASRPAYEAASPLYRLRADAPPFMVLHGTKDSLVAVNVARAFVAAFRKTATAPIAYVEFPWAQHLFDLLCSPRATATARGVATFLDALVASKPTGDPATRSPGPPARP